MGRDRRFWEVDDGYRGEYDWAETPPSAAVVEIVAAATGDSATDLEPLYGTIDPEALDGLLAVDGDPTASWTSVSFAYVGFEIVVESGGTIRASTLG